MSALNCPSRGWDGYCSQNDAPDVTTIWDRAHVARVAGKVCAVCSDPIEFGQTYQTTGMIYDGVFQVWIRHRFADHYPSGCPRFAERDRAALEAEYAADQALFNVGVR